MRAELDPTSEAGVMQAFQAALGGCVQGLEPTSDIWATGGDSIAAMQVLTSCISSTHPSSRAGAGNFVVMHFTGHWGSRNRWHCRVLLLGAIAATRTKGWQSSEGVPRPTQV